MMSENNGCGQHCPNNSFPVPCSTCDRAWMNKPAKIKEAISHSDGVKLDEIVLHGWATGLSIDQTIDECRKVGHEIDPKKLQDEWSRFDAEFMSNKKAT